MHLFSCHELSPHHPVTQIASGSWANIGFEAAIFVGPTLVARCKTILTLLIQKMLAQHVVQTLAQHVV